LLEGLIFDETGRPLRPIRVNQGARRYRFYLSQALQPREEEAAGLRLPAPQLEKLVLETTLEALKAEVGTRALAMKLAGASDRVRRQFLRLIIARAPRNPAFRVDPFKVADQQQPEVPTRRETRPSHHRRVEPRALAFDKPIEVGGVQQRIQPRIEGMPRRLGQLRRRHPQ
jgi:hypothetical protein